MKTFRYSMLVLVSLLALAAVTRFSAIPVVYGSPALSASHAIAANLQSLTVRINDSYFYGNLDQSGLSFTVKLVRNGGVISQVAVTTSSSSFNAFFNSAVKAGDQIWIEVAGSPTIVASVAELTLEVNKQLNLVHVKAPPNSSVNVNAKSILNNSYYYRNGTADSDGNFSTDFSSEVDLFNGDEVEASTYVNNVSTSIREYVAGLSVYLNSSSWFGYAPINTNVSLTLKSSSGTVKATKTTTSNAYGYFSGNFTNPAYVLMRAGDIVELEIPGKPVQSLQLVSIATQSIDPSNDLVTGATLPNGKVVVYANDSYLNKKVYKTVTANAAGNYAANFQLSGDLPIQSANEGLYLGEHANPLVGNINLETGQYFENQVLPPDVHMNGADTLAQPPLSGMGNLAMDARELKTNLAPTEATFDILPGCYTYSTYHDANDNEVRENGLYAGPYVKVYSNSSSSIFIVGQPQEAVSLQLKNALGAIKGTASGTTATSGAISLYLRDTANTIIYPQVNDVLSVRYANGTTHDLSIFDVHYIIDREGSVIYGSGPANANLNINYNSNRNSGSVTVGPDGTFTYSTSSLIGSYSCQVYYRNLTGDDVLYNSNIPQFTIYPDDRYVSGYGPLLASYVATLKAGDGSVKSVQSGTTSTSGYYSVYFNQPVLVGDLVIVDVGPLHFEQAVVALTITANPALAVVSGTAPKGGWLNVFDNNNLGPYYYYNYKYFSADNDGNFSANFNKVTGGDTLRVLYWSPNNRDQVSVTRYVPYVQIDPSTNRVSGYAASGSSGSITIRNAQGGTKSTVSTTASTPYGSFSVAPGIDIVTGDEVAVHLGTLDKTISVIPLNATMDLGEDIVTGNSLPNIQLGVETYHWNGSAFSNYSSMGSLSSMRPTDGTGLFSITWKALADLQSGDFTRLYYVAFSDTVFTSTYFSTHPALTIGSYPTQVQPNSIVEVPFTLSNGAHPQYAFIRWDVASHTVDHGSYPYSSNSIPGVVGNNLLSFQSPAGGTIYFMVYATVDGQSITDGQEHAINVNQSTSTTILDPVSGTTNTAAPAIKVISRPNANLTLYVNSAAIQTGTADNRGYFTFNLAHPLASGTYEFSAAASGTNGMGPISNIVHLTIDPSLGVDPVHILLTSKGIQTHLRDNSGYANLGGQVWTRTGESVQVSIPIGVSNVYAANLYVGGILSTGLLSSGGGVYVGSYSPPTNGTYALSLKIRTGGASGPEQTIQILNGLIDPDGYVYDKKQGNNHRLAGATVTCYEWSEQTKSWSLWNGTIWGQVNPQIVGSDGYYAFFTLPGKYKVKVTLNRYFDYESPEILIVDQPVHLNVPLTWIERIYVPSLQKNK